jgi:two-component system sensor histidine kinase/response regulator
MNEYKPSILIVDDIPSNIQIIGKILQEYDYAIEFATNGNDALDWLETKRFDLVLLDIMMPGMDGFEVCKRITESNLDHKPAIIFITAKTDMESIVKGLELGAVDYVVKPFQKKELLARIRIHLTILQQKYELQQANIFKSKLLSIIGHDLRDPIGSLKSYVDIYLELHPDLDNNIKGFMHEVSGISENAYILLENLLSWAKSQAGIIACKPVVTDFKNIVTDSVSLLSNLASKKNIRLSIQVPENSMVYCDPELISAVIRNLISNAIKFSYKNGMVNIKAAKELDSDGNILVITVEDNGVGIKKENLQLLFGSDIHFTTFGTGNEKGSGLGLKICKEFVEINGGEIWVESTENKGTSFRFSLPLKSQ